MAGNKLVTVGLAVSVVAVIAGVGYVLSKRRPAGLNASFAGFTLNKINSGQTTTRQSTGETAKDFQFYPLINVTPDVNGDITVVWSYSNNFDGIVYNSGSITNVFTGLKGGQAAQLKLTDNRPGNPGGIGGQRDTNRNGAIAIGDVDFAGLGKQDGNWRSFSTAVTTKVTSPSGANQTVNGNLQDNFKSVGALSVGWAGWSVNKQLQKQMRPSGIDALLY